MTIIAICTTSKHPFLLIRPARSTRRRETSNAREIQWRMPMSMECWASSDYCPEWFTLPSPFIPSWKVWQSEHSQWRLGISSLLSLRINLWRPSHWAGIRDSWSGGAAFVALHYSVFLHDSVWNIFGVADFEWG
mmetsp:Transcript_31166/g.66757  ORF Transcript_31166/g.66757 Transcript_31166/m.66757 type:complete len:134 (+) Transcript_31166:903-1304(+)